MDPRLKVRAQARVWSVSLCSPLDFLDYHTAMATQTHHPSSIHPCAHVRARSPRRPMYTPSPTSRTSKSSLKKLGSTFRTYVVPSLIYSVSSLLSLWRAALPPIVSMRFCTRYFCQPSSLRSGLARRKGPPIPPQPSLLHQPTQKLSTPLAALDSHSPLRPSTLIHAHPPSCLF